MFFKITIRSNTEGLLFKDGVLTEKLGPGRHKFFGKDRYSVMVYDLRSNVVVSGGMDVFTKDGATLRVSLTFMSRIVDSMKMYEAGQTEPNR
jgi:hypothetical protein